MDDTTPRSDAPRDEPTSLDGPSAAAATAGPAGADRPGESESPAGPDAESGAAEATAGGTGRKKRRDAPPGSVWRELPILIVVALALAILLKTFLVQAFFIPSGSMENTLQVGDRVMVNKVVYHLRDIKRGDIVVFDGLDSFTPEVTIQEPTNPISKGLAWFAGLVGFAPPSEKDFIKRVIGIPGDHVVCCDQQGRVTVNGVALDETSYLYPGNTPSDSTFDVVVPPDKLWVMGDHRAMSSDSRAHLGQPGGGFVPTDKVIGRAFVVIWPVSDWSWLSNPETFDQPGIDKQPATTSMAPLVSSPLALGLAGAVPVVGVRRAWRRRRYLRRLASRAGP
jgi:signal peptidase I